MRKLEEIYDETVKECLKNNCQSYRSIAIVAMEKAIEEYREGIEDLSMHMKDIDPEITEIVNDNFWDMLADPPEPNEKLRGLLHRSIRVRHLVKDLDETDDKKNNKL